MTKSTKPSSAAKPILMLVGLVGAIVTVLRRRQSHADADLWREATSDSSR